MLFLNYYVIRTVGYIVCVFLLLRTWILKINRGNELKTVIIKRVRLLVGIIIFLFVMPLLYSSSSIDRVMEFYGLDSKKTEKFMGKESALVIENTKNRLEWYIYNRSGKRWKYIPYEPLQRGIHSAVGDFPKYSVTVAQDGNTKGRYVILYVNGVSSLLGKQVRDTKGTKFYNSLWIEAKKYVPFGGGHRIYYGHLEEGIPDNYQLYIDDYEVEVDWKKLMF